MAVVQKLEQLPDNAENFTEEQICALTEPLINCGSSEELMGLAKTASRSLYGELEPTDRVQKINLLVSVKLPGAETVNEPLDCTKYVLEYYLSPLLVWILHTLSWNPSYFGIFGIYNSVAPS